MSSPRRQDSRSLPRVALPPRASSMSGSRRLPSADREAISSFSCMRARSKIAKASRQLSRGWVSSALGLRRETRRGVIISCDMIIVVSFLQSPTDGNLPDVGRELMDRAKAQRAEDEAHIVSPIPREGSLHYDQEVRKKRPSTTWNCDRESAYPLRAIKGVLLPAMCRCPYL